MDLDGSARLILPDSRLKTKRTVVRAPLAGVMVNWVKIFCANCGKPYGMVPEQSCTFACWLCDPCADKWGPQFATALMPEELFWRQVKWEMLDTYGRLLTVEELRKIAESSSPLTTLLGEGAKT